MKFICKCGKVYEKDEEYSKWNYWVRCDCGLQAEMENKPPRSKPMTAFVKGYTEGYNEGLGINIKSKDHYKAEVKKRGLKEVG